MILKPIHGEEWIEKLRRREFWIGMRRKYPQKFYSRLTKSYVGWWLYFRIFAIWDCGALLIDPLMTGGFYSHLKCFLYNWIMVRVVWRARHRIWRLFHRAKWERECLFMTACMQASREDYADPMSAPAGLPAERFHGFILGERYFKRVAEIMEASKQVER